MATHHQQYTICVVFPLLLLVCQSLTAGTQYDFLSSQSLQSLDLSDDTPNIEILHRCQAYIHEFGLASASYMHCAILHSRPFNFCTLCKREYATAMYLYEKMKSIHDDEDTSKTCEDIMLSGDKIMLTTQAHEFVKNSWEDSKCDNCFEGNECYYEDIGNGTLNCTLANHTVVFNEYNTETRLCLKNFTNSTVPKDADDQKESKGCTVCRDLYYQLNDFYIKNEEHFPKGLCMDIVDAMNDTRRIWSKQLHCTHSKGDIAAIVSLASFFCLLPIVFYISSKLHGVREEKKLLKQKRMKNFINSRSTAEESTSTVAT